MLREQQQLPLPREVKDLTIGGRKRKTCQVFASFNNPILGYRPLHRLLDVGIEEVRQIRGPTVLLLGKCDFHCSH